MAARNDIDITIGGKTFTLSGVESEAYLREVAAYLNEKLRNFSDDAAYWRLPNDMRNVMLQLNLADDYFKAHGEAVALQAQVEELSRDRDGLARELAAQREGAQGLSARIQALEADTAGLKDQAQRAAAAENAATKRFGAEKSRAEKLAEEMEALRKSKAEADKAVQRLRQELAEAREGHQGELSRTRTDLQQRLADSEAQRKKEVQALRDERQKEVKDLQARRETELGRVEARRQQEVRALQEELARTKQELEARHRQQLQAQAEASARQLQEREAVLQKSLADTRQDLAGKLQAAQSQADDSRASLERVTEEAKKLRSQLDIALLNEDNARKKLEALEKDFRDQLEEGVAQYRAQAREAGEELEKVRDDLAILQEQEAARLQAAGRVRGTMQELVAQYGRFGQALEEAADQMRAL